MALTQDQVNWWFEQNPNATADDVAAAVKGAGGLDANTGLADMIANRYNVGSNQVTDYYNQYSAPQTGALSSVATGNNTVLEDASSNAVAAPTTSALAQATTPQVMDYEGKGYDPTALKNLAIQLSQFSDPSKLSGGVFGTNQGNIGFDYATGTQILGKAPSTYEQVLLDAARSLINQGVTNIDQLSVGDISSGVDEYGQPINQKSVINTKTGQPLGTFGSTYTGKGGTFYDAGVDPVTGKPYFGTHGESSSSIAPIQEAIQDLGPLGNIALAFVTGGLSLPQQLAANFAYNVAGGADPGKAALNSLAALAGNQVLGVSEINDATKYLKDNFGTSYADAFKGAVSGATKAAVTGQDIGTGALSGGVGSGISSVGTKLFDSYASDTSLSNAEKNVLKSSTSAFISSKLAGATDEEAFKAAALAGSMSAATKVGADFKKQLTTADAGEDVNLPSGVRLAAADTGTTSDVGTSYKVDMGGSPIYAESKGADSVSAPFGYRLMSTAESDERPAGAYYDPSVNAWFTPSGEVEQLSSLLEQPENSDFWKSIGIDENTLSSLGDSPSNADILKAIGYEGDPTDTAKVSKFVTDKQTDNTGGDKGDGDNIDTLTITGDKDVTDLGNLVITDKKDTPEIVIKDTKNTKGSDEIVCGEGFHLSADGKSCVPDEETPLTCPTGFHLSADGKSCVPDDTKKPLTCPEGFELNDEGTACIPVVEIVDKKCGPGFVYDETLKQCVPVKTDVVDKNCGAGYHWDEATQACVKDTVVTPPNTPVTPVTKKTTNVSSASTIPTGGSGKLNDFLKGELLKTYMTKEGFKDPLAALKKAQQELMKENIMQQGVDPQLAAILAAKMGGGDTQDQPSYSYGKEPSSIEEILGLKDSAEQTYKAGGYVQPLMAQGGMALPLLAAKGGLPSMHKGREDFRDGKHVAGEGDGQSDDIPAMLADGEFVFPADVVSALGNGSTKAGTDKLYEMMHSIRDRARSKGPKDLPPPALKSPLDYLKKR